MSRTSSLTHTCEKIEVDWTIFGGYNTLQGKKRRGTGRWRERWRRNGEKKRKLKLFFK